MRYLPVSIQQQQCACTIHIRFYIFPLCLPLIRKLYVGRDAKVQRHRREQRNENRSERHTHTATEGKNGNKIKHFRRWLLHTFEFSFSILVYVFSRCKRNDRRIQGGAVEISHSIFPILLLLTFT